MDRRVEMRHLVLGGTFNPIHIGHLMLAEEVAAEFGYDRVILVPSFMPPHKALLGDPGSGIRLAMVRGAVAGDSLFLVDDCELKRGGVSYTVDTLDYIQAAYGLSGKPGLVIGDDLLGGFSSWRDPEGICARSDLVVARRGCLTEVESHFPHRLAHNMLLPISSSDIRARIAAGRPWHRLVPTFAADYIESHGLYGNR